MLGMQTTYPEANFERYNLFDIHTCNWNRQVLTKEYEKTETKTTIVTHSSTNVQSGCLSVSRKTHVYETVLLSSKSKRNDVG